jgi:uncharacterized repeat protein (TIGR02059 family)
LCFLSLTSYATDYYVSSSGNDSSNGLSSSTPWQTISKVNSVFSSLSPGDRILFKRGDNFYGSLQISRSGSSGSPIIISAYGSGAAPVISGFTSISGWTSIGNGLYSKAITCQSNPNMVTVNDINTPLGRWPNSGVLTIDSHNSNTSISDAALPTSPDWTGAEVVIRKNAYIWDRNKITDHTGSTLYYTSGSDYDATNGFGYFIQNSLSTLDQVGEWYYNGSTFYMYFGSAGPGSNVVKVSTTDQLAVLLNRSYITFDNIAFEGANINAIQINNSGNITVQNCTFNFTGRTAIYGPWNGDSPNCKISNNKISNSNNCAIFLMGDHPNATVTNNTISNTGLIAGMGGNGDGTYNAICVYGDGSLVQYNIVENSGYMGIHFSGNNTNIINNFVNTFNLVKNDGAGIYTYVGTGTAMSGQKVIKNVVLNGEGNIEGDSDGSSEAFGIYMDDRTRNVTVADNSVAYCSTAGIYLHNAHEIEITGNTLFDNGGDEADYGAQILFTHDSYSPDDPIRNLNIKNNIFFARTAAEKVLSFSTTSNDIASLGSSDYNCFAKPVDNSYVARTWSGGWNSVATNRSLSNWQSFTGMDRNSFISPVSVTDLNKIRFEYNPTNSNKVISLDGNYIDCKGSKYTGSITLLPYTSAALIVDPNPSSTPAPTTPPVYVSSVIENSAPAKLVITYNLSLANVIPAVSAFSVKVNSAVRSVSSVNVSGTKVTLTLSSPVVYGNVVTVAYTKPASNPLQTASGGQAATIAAQTVTNKVNAITSPTESINAPPVVVVTGQPYTYSGFQGTINANGSYDPNNDRLSFTWVAPQNIPVSNITGSIINFLSPVVNKSENIEFTLYVSDGQNTEVKVIPVELLPYQPELQIAEVVNIEASGFQTPYYPHNIIDGDIGTMWAVNGDEQWIIMELKNLFSIQHIKLAFQPGQTQEAYFDIFGSEDKETWELIMSKSKSCAFSGNLQVFEFPPSKTGKEFKYVKFVGHGNLANSWNYISEFRIFGKDLRNPSDFDKQIVKVYPNPATSYTNIRIDDQNFSPDYIRIISLAGKIVMEEELDPALREFQVPLDLIKGIYIIQMGKGSVTMFTQKLIISK